MKKFEMPIINVAKFDVEDVLTTSAYIEPNPTEPLIDYGANICSNNSMNQSLPECLPYYS